MRLSVIMAVAAVVFGGSFAQAGEREDKLIEETFLSVEKAEAALLRMKPTKGRDKTLRFVLDAKARLNDLMDLGRHVRPGRPPMEEKMHRSVPAPAPAPVPKSGIAMSHGEFADFLREFDKLSFEAQKIRLIEDATRHNWFTCEQVVQTLKRMDFSRDQIEGAVVFYPRIVDKEDFYKVIGVLKFENDKKELRRRIEASHPHH